METALQARVAPANVAPEAVRERVAWVDFAKGLVIFIVLFFHNPALDGWGPKYWLLSVAMPSFFFICGMLAKLRSPSATLRREARCLLVPYLAGCALGLLLTPLSAVINLRFEDVGPWTVGHIVNIPTAFRLDHGYSATFALWFLPALFEVRLLHSLLWRRGPVRASLAWLAVALGGLALWQIVEMPQWSGILASTMMAMTFYCLGVLCRGLLQLRPSAWTLTGVLIVVLPLLLLTVDASMDAPTTLCSDIRTGHVGDNLALYAAEVLTFLAVLLAGAMLIDRLGARRMLRWGGMVAMAAIPILLLHVVWLKGQYTVLYFLAPSALDKWYVALPLALLAVAILTWTGLHLRRRYLRFFGPR